MIRIEHIQKSYKDKVVLKDISFAMTEGSCVGILGGNGSGKTTLLSVLAGVLKACRGHFFYGERDLLQNRKQLRELVGLVPQNNPLIEELSAYDNLRLWYEKKALEHAVREGVVRMLGVDAFLKKPVHTLSGGMKKRLALACAVADNPRILLMDEPSAALDIVCKENIHRYIREHLGAGGSVLLVTHDLSELDLCDKHYILREGVLREYRYDGDTERLAALLE